MSSTILLTDTIFNVILSVSINALFDAFSYVVNDKFHYALFVSFTNFFCDAKFITDTDELKYTLETNL